MKTKKINKCNLFTMLMLVMALLIPQWGWSQTASKPAVGDGSKENPFLISSAEELVWFRDWVNEGSSDHTSACAKLIDNIDLSEISWTPIGNRAKNISYYGIFDGNGKKISNFNFVSTDNYGGFFGEIKGATIKNITFDNAKVHNYQSATGIVAGRSMTSSILGVSVINSNVTGKDYTGGIIGVSVSSKIANCYCESDISGNQYAGGIVGYYNSLSGKADILRNIFSSCNVTYKSYGGLLAGEITQEATVRAVGLIVYNKDAKLTENGKELLDDNKKSIGSGKLTVGFILGCSRETLKSGVVAYMLQQKRGTDDVTWGQNLSTENSDAYPMLGSPNRVYTNSNVTLSCQGSLNYAGTFTNDIIEDEEMCTSHSNPSIHKDGTAATCTKNGILEHYECQTCHSAFEDKQLTREIEDIIVPAQKHNYGPNDNCINCNEPMPTIALGSNSIQIREMDYQNDVITGYNIFKITPTKSGILDYKNDKVRFFSLWDSSKSKGLFFSQENTGTLGKVEANTTYYLGVKGINGIAIDGDVELTLGISECPNDLAGDGSKDNPFVLKTAEHLKFFADYVTNYNTTHKAACAKIADEVNEIDMSSICHAAEGEYETEVSWKPIDADSWWSGFFDGNGKTISNLYIDTSDSYYVGLFGCAYEGVIKNLTLKKAIVKNNASNGYSGILVGRAYNSKIQNIVIDAESSINAKNNTGGIVGYVVRSATVTNCINHAIVNGNSKVGGIVGNLERGNLENVFNNSHVTATESGGLIVGYSDPYNVSGVVAYNKDAVLTINGTQVEAKATGSGTLSSTAYTKDDVQSGKLAYALNNGVTDGSQIWYQKLGEDGDAYPMMKSTGENTVYHGTKCNKITDVYTNDNSIFGEDGAIPHKNYHLATEPDANGIYSDVCVECNSPKEGVKYIKDFCGEIGRNLKLAVDSDGGYSTEESFVLSDKAAYNSPVDFEVSAFTYTRNNPHTEWQVYYVPFDIDYSELANAGITAAYINNFHEYTKNGETEVVLEVKEVTSGTLKANVPYVIKAATSGETQIHANNVMLHKAEAKALSCQSVTHDYSFKGVYKALSGFNQDENINNGIIDYTLKGGEFLELTKTATLSPMRWYLTICDRNKATETSSAQSARVSSIQIKVVGEGEATGIEDIHVITDGNVYVNHGIYDLQGRRLSAEPAHGVYIKNGKKIIK